MSFLCRLGLHRYREYQSQGMVPNLTCTRCRKVKA